VPFGCSLSLARKMSIVVIFLVVFTGTSFTKALKLICTFGQYIHVHDCDITALFCMTKTNRDREGQRERSRCKPGVRVTAMFRGMDLLRRQDKAILQRIASKDPSQLASLPALMTAEGARVAAVEELFERAVAQFVFNALGKQIDGAIDPSLSDPAPAPVPGPVPAPAPVPVGVGMDGGVGMGVGAGVGVGVGEESFTVGPDGTITAAPAAPIAVPTIAAAPVTTTARARNTHAWFYFHDRCGAVQWAGRLPCLSVCGVLCVVRCVLCGARCAVC
jgi:hypothetical protein